MRDVPQRDVARVGLLLCDHAPGALRPIAGDYDDMFAALLAHADPTPELAVYDVTEGEYPEGLTDCAGYLISGSSASVYDDSPWIAALEKFVVRLHEAAVPTVGVCFGHQMVARALGGEVARSDRGWGVGVRRVPISARRGWMRPPRDSVAMVVSHQDQVLTLPADATRIGGDAHCPLGLFTVGEHILCMQGHPEYPPAYGRALAEGRAGRIPAAVLQAAAPTFDHATDAPVLAQWITRFITREGQ